MYARDYEDSVLCSVPSAEAVVMGQLEASSAAHRLVAGWSDLVVRLGWGLAVRYWMYRALTDGHNLDSGTVSRMIEQWSATRRRRTAETRLVDDVVPPGVNVVKARALWRESSCTAVALRQMVGRTEKRLHRADAT